ncbi:hypothetical protein HDU91_000441, partial [Kappamyces sp. JEL0680]
VTASLDHSVASRDSYHSHRESLQFKSRNTKALHTLGISEYDAIKPIAPIPKEDLADLTVYPTEEPKAPMPTNRPAGIPPAVTKSSTDSAKALKMLGVGVADKPVSSAGSQSLLDKAKKGWKSSVFALTHPKKSGKRTPAKTNAPDASEKVLDTPALLLPSISSGLSLPESPSVYKMDHSIPTPLEAPAIDSDSDDNESDSAYKRNSLLAFSSLAFRALTESTKEGSELVSDGNTDHSTSKATSTESMKSDGVTAMKILGFDDTYRQAPGRKAVSEAAAPAKRMSSLALKADELTGERSISVAETSHHRRFAAGYMGKSLANSPVSPASFFVLTSTGLFEFRSHQVNQKSIDVFPINNQCKLEIIDADQMVLRLTQPNSSETPNDWFLTCPGKKDMEIWLRGLRNAISLEVFSHLTLPGTPVAESAPAPPAKPGFRGSIADICQAMDSLVEERRDTFESDFLSLPSSDDETEHAAPIASALAIMAHIEKKAQIYS